MNKKIRFLLIAIPVVLVGFLLFRGTETRASLFNFTDGFTSLNYINSSATTATVNIVGGNISLTWDGSAFAPSQVAVSNILANASNISRNRNSNIVSNLTYTNGGSSVTKNILSATIYANQTLNGQTISYYLSIDNGVNWEGAALGTEHIFTNAGSNLAWKAILSTTNTAVTPIIDEVNVTFAFPVSINITNTSFRTNDTTPTVYGTAYIDYSTLKIIRTEFKIDTGSWFGCGAVDGAFDSNYEQYNCTTYPLLSGTHTLQVRAIDTLGNWSNASFSSTFTVDTKEPNSEINPVTSPTNSNPLTITGTATD